MLWDGVVYLMESVHGIYRRHDGTRPNTYKVVNAPVVGCRSWGAACLRVGVTVDVASVISKGIQKTGRSEL